MQKTIDFWLKHANPEMVSAMKKLKPEELADAFNEELTFGTAGIRGIMGPGPNRMNIYTIIKATYGYAKFLRQKYGPTSPITIIIGTDNRHHHNHFATVAANVLMQFKIQVFKSLIVPTPLVSFAIRHMKAQGGIIITASHNPPTYNGYKVYDANGKQLLPAEADRIAAFSKEHLEYLTYPYRENRMALPPIPSQVITSYLKAIQNLQLKPESLKNLKIVFSPQHGTSAELLPKLLKTCNYEVVPVLEQMEHDPNFSQTPSPNPEDPAAYQLGLKYLSKTQSDILITTDPDADRIGVVARKDNKWEILTGNQLAIIIFDYLIRHKKAKLKKPMMLYSYVSTDLCAKMAFENQIKAIPVATGFKWVGHHIEQNPDYQFLFGFEESYGCLLDANIARDKDALQAALMVAEIANEAKQKEQSLWDLLTQIYQKYGFRYENTTTLNFTGLDANKQRSNFMSYLRVNQNNLFAGKYSVEDLKNGKGSIAPMNLLKFTFAEGSIAVRPSGTEPKIKFYQVVHGNNINALDQNKSIINHFMRILKNLKIKA